MAAVLRLPRNVLGTKKIKKFGAFFVKNVFLASWGRLLPLAPP